MALADYRLCDVCGGKAFYIVPRLETSNRENPS